MLEVFFRRSTGKQDVVNVHVTEMQSAYHLIHKPLEGLGCVPEPKRHAQELKKSEGSGYGSLGDILLCRWNLMVCPDQVNVCEDRGPLKCGREILEMRNRIPSGIVQSTEISAWPPIPWCALGDHVQR